MQSARSPYIRGTRPQARIHLEAAQGQYGVNHIHIRRLNEVCQPLQPSAPTLRTCTISALPLVEMGHCCGWRLGFSPSDCQTIFRPRPRMRPDPLGHHLCVYKTGTFVLLTWAVVKANTTHILTLTTTMPEVPLATPIRPVPCAQIQPEAQSLCDRGRMTSSPTLSQAMLSQYPILDAQ